MSTVRFGQLSLQQIRRGKMLERKSNQTQFEVKTNPIISPDKNGLMAWFQAKALGHPFSPTEPLATPVVALKLPHHEFDLMTDQFTSIQKKS